MKRILGALVLAFTAGAAFAQASPVGLWKTIDDETKQEKSLVRISESAGVLSGRIEKIVDPAKQDSVCDKCEDARKGQKVLGMTIVEGVKKNAGEPYWDGGTILDPNNGKSYNAKVTVIEGGKKLEMRGSILFIGRTQTWIRAE